MKFHNHKFSMIKQLKDKLSYKAFQCNQELVIICK